MTRLTWGNVGERFFETGVDHGVLYPPTGYGVPWNGLVSISEAASGGEPTPYYMDGRKYINVSSAEEFTATITALSSPPEFNECDGTATIAWGLYATQQPRKSFGLAYRTFVGNDIDGVDHGYKIHLVYNALAAPSSSDSQSISDSVELVNYSWAIATLPRSLTGRKPTAHLVIDSRKTPKGLMRTLEDMLYGTEISEAWLPTPQEIADLFITWVDQPQPTMVG